MCFSIKCRKYKRRVFNITNGEQAKFKDILENFLYAIDEKPKYLKLPFGLLYGVACITEKIFKTFNIEKEPTLNKIYCLHIRIFTNFKYRKSKRKIRIQTKNNFRRRNKCLWKMVKENKKN